MPLSHQVGNRDALLGGLGLGRSNAHALDELQDRRLQLVERLAAGRDHEHGNRALAGLEDAHIDIMTAVGSVGAAVPPRVARRTVVVVNGFGGIHGPDVLCPGRPEVGLGVSAGMQRLENGHGPDVAILAEAQGGTIIAGGMLVFPALGNGERNLAQRLHLG